MTSRGGPAARRSPDPGAERRGAWARCGRPGRYAQAPWLPRALSFPARPMAWTWREVLTSLFGYFFCVCVGKGKERVGGPWRHVDATANLGPRRAHGFPPGAPGCDVFREVRPSPDGWGFSFEARVRFLKSGRWFFAAADTPVNTDDKSSAKWLLERIAEQGERWGRVKVT